MSVVSKGKQGQTDANMAASKNVTISTDVTDASKNGVNKNPAAVALGRLGGLKGGKARAEKLTSERRAEIAKAAAIARWKKGTVESHV